MAVAATMVAAGITLASPASADPVNPNGDAFLSALNPPASATRTTTPTSPHSWASGCARCWSSRASRSRRWRRPSPTTASIPAWPSFFTGIAISMYCPQMMGSIGNGTFLNILQGTARGMPGVPRVPSFSTVPDATNPPCRERATKLDVWYFPI